MFLKVLERITGKKSIRPGMDAVISGNVWLSELKKLALWTRKATREPVKLIPGKKIDVFTTGDIDDKTGKLYPDYLERREARKKEACAEVLDRDVRPD